MIVLLVGLLAAWPLLTPGFIPTHDGEYHLIRFYEFDKNIKAGIFFPRWAPGLNSGLGVPLFQFFYPLPNYVAEIFYLSGFSLVESFKLTLAVGLMAGGLFFYLWSAKIFGAWAGMVGAVFYTLAPYHLLDVYVRGSPGEVLALVFWPAILWALEKKSWLATIFLAFLILSHNILALIFMPFLFSYLIFRKSVVGYWLSVVLIGFGLSAYFWLPAIMEAKYVTGLNIVNPLDHFPSFFQLFIPSWGTGYSLPGIGDGMSFQIGIPHLLTVSAGLIFWRHQKFFLIWLGVSLFFILEVSAPIWKMMSSLALIQYPWRLLSLVILVTSFLAAALVAKSKSKAFAVGLVVLALLFYGGYSRPVKYPSRSDSFYLNNPTWTQGTATLGNSFKIKAGVNLTDTLIQKLAGKISVLSLLFGAVGIIFKKNESRH